MVGAFDAVAPTDDAVPSVRIHTVQCVRPAGALANRRTFLSLESTFRLAGGPGTPSLAPEEPLMTRLWFAEPHGAEGSASAATRADKGAAIVTLHICESTLGVSSYRSALRT